MKPDRSKHHIPGFCPLKNAFTKRLQRGEVKEDIEKRLPDFSKYVDPQKAHWLLRMFAARPQPKYTQLTVDIYIIVYYCYVQHMCTVNICKYALPALFEILQLEMNICSINVSTFETTFTCHYYLEICGWISWGQLNKDEGEFGCTCTSKPSGNGRSKLIFDPNLIAQKESIWSSRTKM